MHSKTTSITFFKLLHSVASEWLRLRVRVSQFHFSLGGSVTALYWILKGFSKFLNLKFLNPLGVRGCGPEVIFQSIQEIVEAWHNVTHFISWNDFDVESS